MEVIERLVDIEDPSEASWNRVFHRLMMNMDRFVDLERAKHICYTLIRKLEEVGCSNKNSAWKIAQVIVFWRDTGVFFLPSDFHLSGNIFKTYKPTAPYSTVYLRPDLFSVSPKLFNLLQFAVRNCEVQFVKLFLNNGLLQPPDITTEDNFKEAKDTIWNICLCSEVNELICESTNKIHSQIRLLRLLRGRFLNGRDTKDILRGFKRIMLISKCIRVLRDGYRDYPNTAGAYVECLRLYFRGVEDPFVGADEVREFIKFFVVDVNEAAIDNLVTVFRSLFPESNAPYQPRSLKHLCRHTVRTILSEKSEPLPELLKNLSYPYSLKMYILGNH